MFSHHKSPSASVPGGNVTADESSPREAEPPPLLSTQASTVKEAASTAEELPLNRTASFSPESTIENLATFQLGEIMVSYLLDRRTHAVGLTIVPLDRARDVVEHRTLEGRDPAWSVEPLVQLKCVGDPPPAMFRQGRTMKDGASVSGLRFAGQKVQTTAEGICIVTTLAREGFYRCEHRLTWREGVSALECSTSFYNESTSPISLEMLSSFSIGGLSPFARDDAPGRLVLHRLRSAWSAEGRLESRPIEELQLESFSYTKVPAAVRFGQVGSMPVRGWFPFAAVEDKQAGVFWGAQIAWAGSWQMEVSRQDDMLGLSGGLADREFGHWLKTVAPGESLTSPLAILTTSTGDLDTLCARLLSWQEHTAVPPAEADADLPIVFNEWCTTWGCPTHDKLIAIADALAGSHVRYLVIDAGWHVQHGDWSPDTAAFPHGLKATVQAIRDRGLIPGVWFELETCHPKARAAELRPGHFLTRDGLPIEVQSRLFWDFRDPRVSEHLAETVIDLLAECGFGYLKIDYNETIGIGCDGAESLGEGLRQQIMGVQSFWRRIRTALPHVVIENCSSGGHRLEPSMMALADQASFSDAHEGIALPIIAANVQRAILPRKSQVWVVLRKQDDARRLIYSLAATFLGRMGASGDVTELDGQQMEIFRRAQAFYCQVKPVIRKGFSRRYGPEVLSYRHPIGWQAVVRANESMALVVCHVFAAPFPGTVRIELPSSGRWEIQATFGSEESLPRVEGDRLLCPLEAEWSACAVLLVRKD